MSNNLLSLTAAVLVTVHNNLATTIDVPDVKRFPSKDKAVERITALLGRVNEVRSKDSLPLIAIAEDGKLFVVEEAKTETSKTETTKSAAPTQARKKAPGRAPAVAPSDVIILKVAENPKRADAADRFSKYETGITVADYFERVGGSKQGLRDLNWDTKKGWVQVVSAKTAAAKAARASRQEALKPKDEAAESGAPEAHEVPAQAESSSVGATA